MRAAIGIHHRGARIAAHAASAQLMIGDGLFGCGQNLGASRLQNLHRPALHIGENLLVVFAEDVLAARHRQTVRVELVVIEIHKAMLVRQHLSVRREIQECRIALFDRFLVGFSESRQRSCPSDGPAVLIVELYAKATRIVSLARMHE